MQPFLKTWRTYTALSEGKFEQEATQLVRDMFIVLRQFIESPNSPLNLATPTQDNSDVPIGSEEVPAKKAKKIFKNKERYSIDEATLIVTKYDMDEGLPVDVGGRFDVERFRKTGVTSIVVEIDITNQFSKEDYNEAHLELKEIIRHEMEHSVQKWNPEDDPIDIWSYFKSKNEVEAYAAGLYKRAKIEKKPFEEVVDEFITKVKIIVNNRYHPPAPPFGSHAVGSNEARIDAGLAGVRQMLLNYAGKRFPAAQIKK